MGSQRVRHDLATEQQQVSNLIKRKFHCIYRQRKGFENNELLLEKTLFQEGTLLRKLWYIYTMEYYSAIKKNSFESVLMRWMKLEPVIQSEVSQKDKDQYSILIHIYGILKRW